MPRPLRWRISSWSTWWPRRRAGRRRRKKPPSEPRSEPSATTNSEAQGVRAAAVSRALNNRQLLGLFFMLPAAVLLLLFLTYPLGLGTWLGFTDARIGRSGEWIGLENFEFLVGDSVARLALFNTLF